jgi:type II secretory pathway predicted ATPase ExeA
MEVFYNDERMYHVLDEIERLTARNAELEALTKRQVQRTGQLTGEVDKYLRRIEELENEQST